MKKVRAIICIFAVLVMFVMLIYTPIRAANVRWMVSVGYVPNTPPFIFQNESGIAAGLFIDIMDNISKRNKFNIIYIKYENDAELMKAYDDGKCDIALGVIMNKHSKYTKQYTTEIAMSYFSMFVMNKKAAYIKKNTDMNSYLYAYQDKTITYDSRINYGSQSGQSYIVTSNQRDALKMLLSGKVDILIGNNDCIMYLIDKLGQTNNITVINKNIAATQYSMLISERNSYLHSIIERSLSTMYFDGSYEKLHSRWIYDDSEILENNIKKSLIVIGIITAVAVFIVFISSMINKRLKKEVYKKTKELTDANDELRHNLAIMERNNELRKNIVEANPNGLIIVDNKLHITLINKSAREMLEITDGAIGEPVNDTALFASLLGSCKSLEVLAELSGRETEVKIADDSIRTYKLTVVLQKYDNAEFSRAIIMMEDITNSIRKKNQMYDEEKNTALNRMLAGIAHEIRNPLTAIKTYIEAIPKNNDNDVFMAQFVKTVPDEIGKINNLIKKLMDYSVLDTGKRDAIIVRDAVSSCMTLMHHSMKKLGVLLTLDIDDDLIILADKAHFQQIIINLIINSIDALSNKRDARRIKIGTVLKGEKAYINVYDNGCGMTSSEIKRATEPFFTTKKTGTGLGLYLAKQYVAQDGGTIKIISEKNEFTNIVLEYISL